jgi:hypothetical protein
MKKIEQIEVNGKTIDCFIIVEPRRGVRASITKKGLNIRVPLFLPENERMKQIHAMKIWAIEQIARQPQKIESELYDGKKLLLAEIPYTLVLNQNLKKSTIEGNTIFIKTNEKDNDKTLETKLLKLIAPLFEAWLQKAVPVINKSTTNKPIKSITVKNIHSKWGSCSSNGELIFSAKLFLQPLCAIHYVIIHELCHRIEMNHSARYWNWVATFFPKYKEAKKMLKESMF